jgi:hypothetical protein
VLLDELCHAGNRLSAVACELVALVAQAPQLTEFRQDLQRLIDVLLETGVLTVAAELISFRDRHFPPSPEDRE